MSVIFDEEFLTLHNSLNKEEAIIFCLFLQSEYKRHLIDCKVIAQRMFEMEAKHGFNTTNEFFKYKSLIATNNK
jgi:hypothetical protein